MSGLADASGRPVVGPDLTLSGYSRLWSWLFLPTQSDVPEELVKFTWLVRGCSEYSADRCSERIEIAADMRERVGKS